MRRLLLSLLAAMTFVACTQNDVEELTANRADVPETLTVGFEGADDETRVQLQNSKTVWTKGDEVSVFYFSNANQRWQFQGETGERTGKLKRLESAEATAETTYNVVAYPYDSSYFLNPRTCALHATLPATQHYAVDSYGAGGNIMVAQSEFTQFSLRNVCGWLRVELTGEGEVVESVKVRGNNGEQVAGLISVDTATAEATLASEMGEASDEEEVGGIGGGLEFDDTVFTEVTLDCGDGVTLGAEATAFYIALLPQTFEKGMTVEVGYANGNSQPLVCENSITISRNHISPIGIGASEEEDVVNSQIFYTATALVEPYNTSAFNAAIVSNEWDEATGEGVITFDGELTEIGDVAFDYCTSLTSVTIPDSVTTIGDWAFGHCYSLTSVTIGDSVTTIGDYAFIDCSSLTSVTIGDSVTTIGDYAFIDCSSLTSVTIPDSVTTIGDGAFGYCSSLTSVTIPDSVTTIGDMAFANCSNLAEFKGKFAADGGRCLIKDNTIIAYAEASGTTYTIPDSVTTIGYGAFVLCYSLTSVIIPDSVKTIGDSAFDGCRSLESVTIGDSVTTIGYYAFYSCDSLTSVTIPDSVTTIGEWAFSDCDSLAEFKGKFAADEGRCLIKYNAIIAYAEASGTTYTIPDSVTTIGYYAFYSCDSLTSVTIPDSVTTIGYAAFAHCSNLISVYCKAIIPPPIQNDVFDENYTDRKIYVYEECVDAYKTAWSEFADSIVAGGNIPESVTTTILYTTSDGAVIDASKFPAKSHTYNNGVGELILYGELTTIPYEVFRNYDTLTTIIIPDSVTTIGDHAFYYCSSLTSVTIPDSVTTIGDYAFCDCSSLTSVTIDNSVTTIGYSAFNSCESLTSVTIPNSVTTIGGWAFAYCSSLTSVTIPDSVTTIGEAAFASCKSLTEFKGKFAADGGRCLIKDNAIIAYAEASGTTYTIPDSVTTIGIRAFYYCSSLTSVTIPNSVTTIGDFAFYCCSSLTSVTIPDSVTTIGDWAFRDCDSLTSVTIPDSVTTIGNEAFRYCTSLTSVTIPDSVTTIGGAAFCYCSSLTSVYCEAITPPAGGADMFYDTSATIYVPEGSLRAYKMADYWSEYADYIVGYDFETGEVVE